jgi:hypothetical protein
MAETCAGRQAPGALPPDPRDIGEQMKGVRHG